MILKRKKIERANIVLLCLCAMLLVACGDKNTEKKEEELITIGFSQVGAESDWRTAFSISMKDAFSQEKGYDLIFEDARQKQENQIMAIRGFIQQDVDYIVFSPVVESGWDAVLEEAKRAEIPVIVSDRMVDVKEENYYTAWIGSDFYQQGEKACEALKQYVDQRGMENVRIVNIQGTLGATSQIGRTKALEDAAEKYGWEILEQVPGDYAAAKAREIMTELLKEYEDIDFVYCENDNEAFGVIEAIEAAGKKVGIDGDIQIISFDATRGGLQETLAGKIIIDIECNPLQGPEIEKIIHQLEAGESPEQQNYISEQIFTHGSEISEVVVNDSHFTVTEVTEEIIKQRVY